MPGPGLGERVCAGAGVSVWEGEDALEMAEGSAAQQCDRSAAEPCAENGEGGKFYAACFPRQF